MCFSTIVPLLIYTPCRYQIHSPAELNCYFFRTKNKYQWKFILRFWFWTRSNTIQLVSEFGSGMECKSTVERSWWSTILHRKSHLNSRIFRSFHSIRECPDYEVESQKFIFVIWSLAIDDCFTHELCSQKSAENFIKL